MFVMACVYVKCCVFSVCARAVGASSFSAASGSAGLVEAHGFAQPAGKVHLLHFRPLDERVILRESRRENHRLNRTVTGGTLRQQSKLPREKERRKRQSASTDHQELQVCSLRRVFDQTAGATESLVLCHIATNKHTPTQNQCKEKNECQRSIYQITLPV